MVGLLNTLFVWMFLAPTFALNVDPSNGAQNSLKPGNNMVVYAENNLKMASDRACRNDPFCREKIENGTRNCVPYTEVSRECVISCHEGFEPENGKCVLRCPNDHVRDKNGDCAPATSLLSKDSCPLGQYLTAVKGVGCRCLLTKTTDWCDDTDPSGPRLCFSDITTAFAECRVPHCTVSNDWGITCPEFRHGKYQIFNHDCNLWLSNDICATQLRVDTLKQPPVSPQLWDISPQRGGSYRISTAVGGIKQDLYSPNGTDSPSLSTVSWSHFFLERLTNGHFFIRPTDSCAALVARPTSPEHRVTGGGADLGSIGHQPCWGIDAVEPVQPVPPPISSGSTVLYNNTGINPDQMSCSKLLDNGTQVCGPRIVVTKKCTVECDEGYKAQNSETCVKACTDGDVLLHGECVPKQTTVLETFCSAQTEGKNYLSAVPNVGCLCLEGRNENWCQAPADAGEASCVSNADLSFVSCGITHCPGTPTATATAQIHRPLESGRYVIQNAGTDLWLDHDCSARDTKVIGKPLNCTEPVDADLKKIWTVTPIVDGVYTISSDLSGETRRIRSGADGLVNSVLTDTPTTFVIERRSSAPAPNHFSIRPIGSCGTLAADDAGGSHEMCWIFTKIS
ncbi:hypothetical protein B0H11DRAFT_1985613 [Mycena galericulata]|nr:hypothetical protein B0H11DRAFT_1985613 [Mycena galericulata]